MQYTELNNEPQSISRSAMKRSIRILHVVGGMNRCGYETWLMHVLRNADREKFQMDFLVHTDEPSDYDDEVRALGCRIITCPLSRSQPLSFMANLKRILREEQPYDIVHSHVHNFSGFVLRVAKQAGVPIRIAHSHNDTSLADAEASLIRRLYLALTLRWIDRYSTLNLSASRDATPSLFGADWEKDPRCQIISYGIDLSPFEPGISAPNLRAEFNIPEDAFVIGHVGRFEDQKNHSFLIEIAAEIAQREPKMHLLLIGAGPLRSKIEQKIVDLGLMDRVTFAGVRPDVPQLMLEVMDAFLFPSRYEGLGLVLVEAQSSGLPCVFSDVIPEEASLVEPLLKRLSLSLPASQWAEELLNHCQASSEVSQPDALALVKQSPLNIETSLKQLTKIYQAQFEDKP